MKCPIYIKCPSIKCLSMKCPIYEMSFNEMSVYKMSFYEMSQHPSRSDIHDNHVQHAAKAVPQNYLVALKD